MCFSESHALQMPATAHLALQPIEVALQSVRFLEPPPDGKRYSRHKRLTTGEGYHLPICSLDPGPPARGTGRGRVLRIGPGCRPGPGWPGPIFIPREGPGKPVAPWVHNFGCQSDGEEARMEGGRRRRSHRAPKTTSGVAKPFQIEISFG